MTNEKRLETVCEMLREYDLHTGNRAADGVITHPEKWVDAAHFPFYAAAAEMLVDIRAGMDAKTTPRAAVAAIRRIARGANREDFRGIFSHGGRFCVCDGYRLLRLKSDVASVPHVETEFDVDGVMKGVTENAVPLRLPTVGTVKAWIALDREQHGGKRSHVPYVLTYGDGEKIGVNPQYLIDMLQALPDCTAVVTGPIKPIYFTAENGDGILLPVRLKDEENAKKAA